MEYSAQLRIIQNDLKRVAVRLPVVHDHRQSVPKCDLDLTPEELLLLLLVNGIPVIVEADLPDRQDSALSGKRIDPLQVAFPAARPFLRVDADRSVDMRIALRQTQGALAANEVTARDQHESHSVLRQRRKQLVPVCVKGFVVIMCVRIEIHASLPSLPFQFSPSRDILQA